MLLWMGAAEFMQRQGQQGRPLRKKLVKTIGTFGETLGGSSEAVSSSSLSPVVYGFQGMQYDEESGQYHTLHRQYDPSAGRWTTPDPIGFAAGDLNLYRFVGNDPVNWVDPTGLIFEQAIAKVLNPERQATFRAVTAAFGSYTAQIGLRAIQTPVGAIATALGGFLVYEGGLNAAEGLSRIFKPLDAYTVNAILNKREDTLVCR